MYDTPERGSTGIGGLLILLALIIIAMIAAGTVLYMADQLRGQTDELPYISLLVVGPGWQLLRARWHGSQ
ncbi:MAG: hypothetical protein A07HN63_01959 [uncultured archaeon A07HN63]|nr:MAG: hypothetical protein A07HN63_01959 [uncultured archaeon A07HN63]